MNQISLLVTVKKAPKKEIAEDNKIFSVEFALEQNYPNPFNPTTANKIFNKRNWISPVKEFMIFLGKEIATLVNENKEAGNYSVLILMQQNYQAVFIFIN